MDTETIQGNGHDTDAAASLVNDIEGGIVDITSGMAADFIQSLNQDKKGVLQTLVHAILKDSDYRQVLLTATFKNEHQAVAWADAINEALRYGASIRPHVDRIVAMGSVNGRLRSEVVQAVSSYTINTPGIRQNTKYTNRGNKDALS